MSLRKAINDKCKDCIHDTEAPGTWREQVAQCSSVKCPLWPYRPAPSGGPFANPPRLPEGVDPEWVRKPMGEAISRPRRPVGYMGDVAGPGCDPDVP